MAQNTDHFAIVVGIDGYSQLRRLTASVRDATLFCEWLLSPKGGNLPLKNVRQIVSPGKLPANPLRATPIQDEIDQALHEFGASRGYRIGRRLYFYFAGHGFGPTFDDVGMLMANAAMERLKANIGLRPYRAFLHDTRLFDELVMIVDCCRDLARKIETREPVFTPNGFVQNAAAKVEEFLVLATTYGEQAFAPVAVSNGERRGLLTQAVLKGLSGDPRAIDANGQITAASLREYVLATVKQLAGALKQDPEIPVLPSSKIVFREFDPSTMKRVRVHIIAEDDVQGELVLRHGNNLAEIERRDAADAREGSPWEVLLLATSRYELEWEGSEFGKTIQPSKAQQEPYVVRIRSND